MGLFKQAEFAKICGIEQAYLTMNRKREKVIVDEDGMVDDSNSMNAAFKAKCLARPKKEAKEVENAVVPPSGDKPGKASTPKAKGNRKPDKYDERFDLDTEKKRAEIKKIERETQLADMKHEKMVGKVMPTDAIKSLFIHTIKNFTISFKQAADKIVQDYSARAKLNRNDQAALKGELILAINHASENAVMESKKGAGHIIREYSEAKEL